MDENKKEVFDLEKNTARNFAGESNDKSFCLMNQEQRKEYHKSLQIKE